MKHAMAKTKNVQRFIAAIDALNNATPGTEKCGLLWGDPGEGKTTTVAYAANIYDAIFVRAVGCWTVTSMLGELCKELGGHRMCRRSDMIEFICKALADKPRPVFIDEADYLFAQESMLDAVRDIYDLSGCPVILIGMEDIARKIQNKSRFARRITQWVEFSGIDMDDARTVVKECSEVEIDDDLLRHLHKEAAGNIGRIIIGLSRIEVFAKSNRLGTVTLRQWDNRPFFYDQPVFGRKKKVEA
ncbi:MAG: AAA family ATPase [Proteobacteria bacterium]|nr:AAA family ATPase [Pseudomonadota bacterium]